MTIIRKHKGDGTVNGTGVQGRGHDPAKCSVGGVLRTKLPIYKTRHVPSRIAQLRFTRLHRLIILGTVLGTVSLNKFKYKNVQLNRSRRLHFRPGYFRSCNDFGFCGYNFDFQNRWVKMRVRKSQNFGGKMLASLRTVSTLIVASAI